jgi:hypothetical protein
MGFLLRDTQLRELFEDLVSLNFQLPSQLINTNLLHKNKSQRGDAPDSPYELRSSTSS